MPTLFIHLAQIGDTLAQTAGKRDRITLIAEFLTHLDREEIPLGARFLIGQVFPPWDKRQLNVSWGLMMRVIEDMITLSPQRRTIIETSARDMGEAVERLLSEGRQVQPRPTLTIEDVYRACEALAAAHGPGARAVKERILRELFQNAHPQEAKYIVKILGGEMRHGVGEGLMLEAIARAAHAPPDLVRRAFHLWGDVGDVALAALTGGVESLRKARIRLFHPIRPMLAQTAPSLEAALERMENRAALEFKLDGARVQIHRHADEVRIYSRRLAEVTESLPDVARQAQEHLQGEAVIVEGEVIAVDAEGRPLPFQYLMRRFRRKSDIESLVKKMPVRVYLFDALYRDGVSYLDTPNRQRWAALEDMCGGLALVPRHVPAGLEDARQFLHRSYEAGHEGLMVKDANSPYTPGIRGGAWLKVKHTITLDLVIVAAEWGYGRRHGWLSNYHLAARDEHTGEFVVVGKTFKGLTDEEFERMTRTLLALETGQEDGIVHVQPKVVVEVTFNEIQASPHYPSGYALRFARITRIRDDKRPEEADTIQTIQALYEKQFRYKGRPTNQREVP